MAAATPSVAPGRGGQERGRRGRRDGLPRRQAHRLQDLEVGHARRGVPGHGLADQEDRGHQRRQPEGEQVSGLVSGDPVLGVAKERQVVPHVDVRPPGHPGQVGTERGDRRAPPLEPDQRVDVRLPAGAHDVGAVMGEQGGRREHASLLPGSFHVHRPEGRPAHPDDPGPDDGSARRPGRPVIPHAGLLTARQVQGHRVADALGEARHELGRGHDLIDAIGVEQPPLKTGPAVRWSGSSRRPRAGTRCSRPGSNPARSRIPQGTG